MPLKGQLNDSVAGLGCPGPSSMDLAWIFSKTRYVALLLLEPFLSVHLIKLMYTSISL